MSDQDLELRRKKLSVSWELRAKRVHRSGLHCIESWHHVKIKHSFALYIGDIYNWWRLYLWYTCMWEWRGEKNARKKDGDWRENRVAVTGSEARVIHEPISRASCSCIALRVPHFFWRPLLFLPPSLFNFTLQLRKRQFVVLKSTFARIFYYPFLSRFHIMPAYSGPRWNGFTTRKFPGKW